MRDIRQKSKLIVMTIVKIPSVALHPSTLYVGWQSRQWFWPWEEGGGRGGVATFFQAPSQQCLTRPVIALHQGQGCEAVWNTLLPIHRNTANSALRRLNKSGRQPHSLTDRAWRAGGKSNKELWKGVARALLMINLFALSISWKYKLSKNYKKLMIRRVAVQYIN